MIVVEEGSGGVWFRRTLVDRVVILSVQIEASMNQVADRQMPAYNLPSKILCRVINVQLRVLLA